MDAFDKKPILPIEIMITVAINIVVATLGYYAMIFLGNNSRLMRTLGRPDGWGLSQRWQVPR
jgi:hypothetical protein